jgi:uncharacterized membrane protein
MKFLKFLFCLIFIVLIFPFQVLAQEKIDSFDSQIIANKNGQLRVTETIKYSFDTFKHGIFRFIPLSSLVGNNLVRNIQIQFIEVSRDGRPENFVDQSNTDQASIKIGNASQTITGSHVYKITYLVNNQIGNYDDHDEIYWNVNGTGWEVPVATVSATIAGPIDVTKTTCYSGVQGSRAQTCGSYIQNGQAHFFTKKSLEPAENLSAVAGFPSNTFPASTLVENKPPEPPPAWLIFTLIGLVAVYYIILPLVVFIWYFLKHHKSRFGPITVNFDFPLDSEGKRLAPAEAGIIDNATLERDDISATIFDLAVRKYLKIVEIKKEHKIFGIGPTSQSLQLQKLKSVDDENLSEFERTLMQKLFEDGAKTVDIDEIPDDFYKTFDKIQEQVYSSLVERKIFKESPTGKRTAIGCLGVVVFLTGNILLTIVMIYIYSKINTRTEEGDKLDWQIDGLKLFLKNMKREYKWQAENLYTVEKYIPFAIALGYIEEFMEQLKILYPNYQPTWYSGSNFYTNYAIYSSLMNNSFATSAPSRGSSYSSSSGFSSGGFSGGGGGGGGGGSW